MSAALFVYQILFPLVALGILAGILFSGRGRALREGGGELRQRLGLIPASYGRGLHDGKRRVLWVHAASVGEVIAAAPLITAVAARADAPRIFITTTTVAGRDKALSIAAADAAFLAPMDFYPAVRVFLKRMRPDALLLMETELWPMTLTLTAAAGIPIALANGRLREQTLARYRMLPGLFAGILGAVRRAAVQDEAAERRFRELGINPDALLVTGNIKYDQNPPSPDTVAAAKARISALGWDGAPLWTAGSTRRGEEEILLEGHKLAAASLVGLRWILAPRHPERVRETEKILREGGIRFARWSEPLSGENNPECLLVDELGVLAGLYACSRAAFVGGTLAEIGGHNILEPALSGVPVMFGPHTASVEEVAAGLLQSGGGARVNDAEGIAAALNSWLPEGPRRAAALAGSRAAAARFNGAAQRTLDHLAPVIFG